MANKLSIQPEGGAPIEVMFNPNSYTITKQVAWTPSSKTMDGDVKTDSKVNAPTLEFGGGHSRQLSMELFFDTTEARSDVRQQTDRIVRLTRIARKDNQPPVCTVSWGKRTTEDFPFVGTIISLTQNFVLFDQDGQPLRAMLNVTFTEFLVRKVDKAGTDPETTTRTVRRGDSLASIAADVYRDSSQWRVIAKANGIENPLAVPAGATLTLPK
jgi:nucleoid-associated protein YgaU